MYTWLVIPSSKLRFFCDLGLETSRHPVGKTVDRGRGQNFKSKAMSLYAQSSKQSRRPPFPITYASFRHPIRHPIQRWQLLDLGGRRQLLLEWVFTYWYAFLTGLSYCNSLSLLFCFCFYFSSTSRGFASKCPAIWVSIVRNIHLRTEWAK
jgi:hypothetical protein